MLYLVLKTKIKHHFILISEGENLLRIFLNGNKFHSIARKFQSTKFFKNNALNFIIENFQQEYSKKLILDIAIVVFISTFVFRDL